MATDDLPLPVGLLTVESPPGIAYAGSLRRYEPIIALSDGEHRLYTRAALDAVRAQERERWETAIGAAMPDDFKDWHQSPQERPAIVVAVIHALRERESMAWDQVAHERERCEKAVEDNVRMVDAADALAAIRAG